MIREMGDFTCAKGEGGERVYYVEGDGCDAVTSLMGSEE